MFKNLKEENVSPEMLNSNNNIGQGTVFTGNIETFGNIRIEGTINGDVTSKAKIVVGPSAKIDGNLESDLCEVEGHVTGSISVTDLLVLKPSCKVEGNIQTNKLVVESGAQFFGNCQMGRTTATSSTTGTMKPATGEKDPYPKTLHKAANQ